VEDLVQQLPSRDRRVLALRYLHGYRFREIGGILGLTAPAARKVASRALLRLRALWSK
jgi:DNA-directed RNA polymerase specialized sigma24 family protein